MAEEAKHRVELIAQPGPRRTEAGRTGAGLLVGLVVARGSLLGAAFGTEQFEVAIGHFVVVVLVCVAGALLIGRLYDRFIRAAIAKHDATAVVGLDGFDE